MKQDTRTVEEIADEIFNEEADRDERDAIAREEYFWDEDEE